MAKFICSTNSSAFSTTRIPFPPPPAAAFTKIGNPISFALINDFSTSTMASSTPSTIGIPYFLTVSFAANLFPINSIDFGEGPIKVIPASVAFLVKSAFSLKKP